MNIATVINHLEDYYKGDFDKSDTRDKVLYGENHLDKACTGIVTSIWASVEVITEAIKKGANLIIVHEALFWNHGDKTDWLEGNATFASKKALLDEHQMVVWRNHDYIHSGIPLENGDTYADGIFLGLFHELGWKDYESVTIDTNNLLLVIRIPEIPLSQLAKEMVNKLALNGAKIYGKKDILVKKVALTNHILGDSKKEISYIEANDIDLVLAAEIVDFTLSEYIIDSNCLKQNKAMISFGHFNLEEPGMKYMLSYIYEALKTDHIPVFFVPAGDMYQYTLGN